MDWKSKLTSRKFWAAGAGIIAGLAMVFGLDEDVISTVAGAVTSIASLMTYIIVEGKVDTTRLAAAVESVQEAAEVLSKEE